MKLKTINYKILQKKSIALITFMYTLSRTMYLFEANLKFLANTSTPDIAQYHLQQNHWSYRKRNTYAVLCNYGDVCQQMQGEPSLQ